MRTNYYSEIISTHTPLARRDVYKPFGLCQYVISTHTPLARRDVIKSNWQKIGQISTHTPLARRDASGAALDDMQQHFYSHASREA